MSKRGFNIRWSQLPETERGEICLGTAKSLREFLEDVDDTALVFLDNDHGDGSISSVPGHYQEYVNVLIASSHPKCLKIVDSWN